MSRLEELLLLWQDQTITERELAELKRLLARPEERARLARSFFLTGVLVESLRAEREASPLLENGADFTTPERALFPPSEPSSPSGNADSWPGVPSPPTRPVRAVWLAGMAALVLAALGVYLWTLLPSPAPTPTTPDAVVAQVEQVQGETFVVSREHEEPAQAGQVVIAGQGIRTEGADSEAVVQMQDAVRLKLGGDTTILTGIEGEQPGLDGPRIVLEQGDLLVEVSRSLRRKKMTVQTPLGVVVTETEETGLHISDAAGVAVLHGEVRFIGKTGQVARIKGGEYVIFSPGGAPTAAQLFSGNGRVWTAFPRAGLNITSLGYAVAFSPDGKLLAAAGRSGDRGVQVGEVDGLAGPSELQGERCLAFSPDGKLLAAAREHRVLLHSVPGGQTTFTLDRNDRRMRVTCLAFSPDGKFLAVGKRGGREVGEVDLWDVKGRVLRATWREHALGVTSLAFSPDGTLLASGGMDGLVVVRDLAKHQERARVSVLPAAVVWPAPVVWSVVFSPGGKTLAVATGPGDFRLRQPGEVWLWDVSTQRVQATLRGHTRAVTSAVFSADGQTLITGGADTTARFWDLTTGLEYGMLKGHRAAPGFEAIAVALAPDGSSLATASMDRTVKVWKTARAPNDAHPRVTLHARLSPVGALMPPALAFLANP